MVERACVYRLSTTVYYGIPAGSTWSQRECGSSKYIDAELAGVGGERDPLTDLAMHAVGIHGYDYCSLVRGSGTRGVRRGGALNSF